MFRLGFSLGVCPKCPSSNGGPIYLTDEAGNRLTDPAGNLIVYG